MATKLTRAVKRETAEIIPTTRRPLIIELCEGGRIVRIREKGRRTFYTVTYRQIWVEGARNAAHALKLAKAARRAELKKQREGR